LVCGVLFGVAPAFRQPQADALAGWRTLGARQHGFRHALVAAQICVSLMLLTGASLLLRSLWNLQNQPLGMRTGGVITAGITLGQRAYAEPARQLEFFDELERRLKRLPGIEHAAISDSVPPSGPAHDMIYAAIDVAGRPRMPEGTGGMVTWRIVTPGYFAALGAPILRGRGFGEEDRDAGRNAVILSGSLAHRMFPAEDPIGRQIRPGRTGAWLTVVGVAGDVKNTALVDPDQPEYYLARKHTTEQNGRSATVILRAIDPAAMARWVRTTVASIDPTVPVTIETLDERVGILAERPRFNAWLLALFAGMGLLLSLIGLYGVISFLVAQRTQEIGVRMALGATPAGIARLMLGHAARWTAAGTALGLAGSLLASRLIESMLFHVSAHDPWVLAGAVAALGAAALLAAWIPSRRAAGVDPMQALRQE
jgi:predicted permease